MEARAPDLEASVLPAEPAEATHLLLLTEGEADLSLLLPGGKHAPVGNVVAGDLLGISALIPPYQLTTSAVARKDGRLIQFEAGGLRDLMDKVPELGYRLMMAAAKALHDRLESTRLELLGSIQE